MSLSERHKPVTATAVSLRAVYGPNAAKKIARRFGIAVVTAKLWLAGRTPTAREVEIARAIKEECARVKAMIAQIEQDMDEVAHAKAGALARGEAGRARAPARGMGRKG